MSDKAEEFRDKFLSRMLDKVEEPRLVELARGLPSDTWEKIKDILEEKP